MSRYVLATLVAVAISFQFACTTAAPESVHSGSGGSGGSGATGGSGGSEPVPEYCDLVDLASLGAPPYSHAADMQPIWNVACVDGCHVPGGLVDDEAWLISNYMDVDAYDNIVNVMSEESDLMIVAPGDPANSYLLIKMAGTTIDLANVNGAGLPMPFGANRCATEVIDVVEAWIAGGALP